MREVKDEVATLMLGELECKPTAAVPGREYSGQGAVMKRTTAELNNVWGNAWPKAEFEVSTISEGKLHQL